MNGDDDDSVCDGDYGDSDDGDGAIDVYSDDHDFLERTV